MSVILPSKPSSRRVSAALAPARLAPMMTNPRSSVMTIPSRWRRSLLAGRGPWPASAAGAGQGQEFGPGALVVAYRAVQGRGDRAGSRGAHAPQGHAQVLGFEHHADAPRTEVLVQPMRDLRRQPLLDLQPPGKVLDHPGELGQPEDARA